MFLTKIKASEIISHVKPEFAQFVKPAKRVTYKPLYPAEFPKVPDHLESNFNYMMKALYARESSVNEQVMTAQSAIENYARSKGVDISMARKVDIIEGNKIDLTDRILIDVFNPKTKAHAHGAVPVFDAPHTATAVKKSQVMLDTVDGTQVIRPVQSEYEDTFVRSLYRTIENLVKKSSLK